MHGRLEACRGLRSRPRSCDWMGISIGRVVESPSIRSCANIELTLPSTSALIPTPLICSPISYASRACRWLAAQGAISSTCSSVERRSRRGLCRLRHFVVEISIGDQASRIRVHISERRCAAPHVASFIHGIKRLVTVAGRGVCRTRRTAGKIRSTDARGLVDALRRAKNLHRIATCIGNGCPCRDSQGVRSASRDLRAIIYGRIVNTIRRPVAHPLILRPSGAAADRYRVGIAARYRRYRPRIISSRIVAVI